MADTALQLDSFLPYRLSFTSNLVSQQIAQAYESLFGLNIPEWRVIAVIAEEGAVTQREICARTRMDKVTVSRAAIRLASHRVLERSPNAGDGRSHRLSLTAAGRRLYENIVPKAREMEAAIFAPLSEDDRATLTTLLRRIDAPLVGE